jgi:peptidase C25-like protein
MYIGRIPVNNVAELNAVISKTIAFEQAGPQAYQTNSLFIADNADPAGNFSAVSDQAINNNYPPYFQASRVYIDDFITRGICSAGVACPAANNVVTTTLNQTGTLFVVYNGHGNPDYWASEQPFGAFNIPQLTNINKLPIILSLTCQDGMWFIPNRAGFMEQILRAPNGGAVATFSPTGLGVATGHSYLTSGFLDAVFKNGIQRIGPASVAAKLNLYSTGENYDLINTFEINGDPALHLPTYLISASPNSIARSGDPGSVVTYTLRVTNSAYLYDQITVTPYGNSWPVTSTSPSIPPRSSASIVVSVTVPTMTLLGVRDVVSITLASHGDAALPYHSILTTTVNLYRVLLPIVFRQ